MAITFRGLPPAVFTVALAKVSFTVRPRVAEALAEAQVLTKDSLPVIKLKIQKYMADSFLLFGRYEVEEIDLCLPSQVCL